MGKLQSTASYDGAVTAYDHPEHGPVLLGVGAVAWGDHLEQTESLPKSHELRKCGMTADNIAKRDSGGQMLVIDQIKIALEVDSPADNGGGGRASTAADAEEAKQEGNALANRRKRKKKKRGR
jgi:hypothetical protein